MMRSSFLLLFISSVFLRQTSQAREPPLHLSDQRTAGTPRFGDGLHLQLTHHFSNVPGSSYHSSEGSMTRDHHSKLRDHDSHRRRKLSTINGGADFVLQGNPSPTVAGLYWTRIGLGVPAQQFSVQVDTGSDLTWVQCDPCQSCASSSNILQNVGIPFNTNRSSTDNFIDCNSAACTTLQTTQSGLGVLCSPASSKCYYQLVYGDGSTSEGYVLTDVFSYSSLNGSNTSTPISFGCGFNQTGNLLSGGQSVDGIMGLGMGPLSIPTQLAAAQVTSQEFAQCLGGEAVGGGSLVFGSVDAQNASFTPLVTDTRRSQYFVTLNGISVGSTALTGVSAASFGTVSGGGGVILDSGSTLAVVPDPVLMSLVTELQSRVTQLPLLSQQASQGQVCWQFGRRSASELGSFFPPLTLRFEGADMLLGPQHYLLLLSASNGGNAACVGWQGGGQDGRLTILGDIVLKEKLVIYDYGNSRVGWEYMDCEGPHLPVYISATGSIKTNNITTVIGTPVTSASHVAVVSNVLPLVATALVALALVV